VKTFHEEVYAKQGACAFARSILGVTEATLFVECIYRLPPFAADNLSMPGWCRLDVIIDLGGLTDARRHVAFEL